MERHEWDTKGEFYALMMEAKIIAHLFGQSKAEMHD